MGKTNLEVVSQQRLETEIKLTKIRALINSLGERIDRLEDISELVVNPIERKETLLELSSALKELHDLEKQEDRLVTELDSLETKELEYEAASGN